MCAESVKCRRWSAWGLAGTGGDVYMGSWQWEVRVVKGLLWCCVFQNGRFLGDADLERQKYPDLKLNGPQVRGSESSGCGQPACWVGIVGGGVQCPHPS